MHNLDNDILITVNICCYNSSKYLNETINSVLNQTYSNWELLIIDDGSTDNTKYIVEQYLNKNSKIRYYYQKNKGYSNARNKAINLSKGNWISLIDHDDVMFPERLLEQVSEIKKHPNAKLFSSNSQHIDDQGNYIIDSFSKFNPLNLDFSSRNAAFELIKNGCFVGTETVTFNKEVALKIGGFNENYKFLGDYDFFIKLALNYNIHISNKILSKHRVHKKNAQFYYFSTGKGYWEYVKVYIKYFFNINFLFNEKIVIIKRTIIYINYGIIRFILNNKFFNLAYTKLKRFLKR